MKFISIFVTLFVGIFFFDSSAVFQWGDKYSYASVEVMSWSFIFVFLTIQLFDVHRFIVQLTTCPKGQFRSWSHGYFFFIEQLRCWAQSDGSVSRVYWRETNSFVEINFLYINLHMFAHSVRHIKKFFFLIFQRNRLSILIQTKKKRSSIENRAA